MSTSAAGNDELTKFMRKPLVKVCFFKYCCSFSHPLVSCGTHSIFSRSQSSDMNIEMSIEARGIIDLHLSSELRKKKIDLEVCTILFFFNLLSLLNIFHLTSRRKKHRFPLEKSNKIWIANSENIGMYVSEKDSHTT